MNPILIVDDEAAIAMLVRRILTEAGYRCQAVTDSRAAADLLEKNCYDLVLLDVMMPHLDGYDLLAYLRPTGTPCIFITAKDAVAERVRGLNSGADDYIVKPFAPTELVARVESVLRRAGRSTAVYTMWEYTVDAAACRVLRGEEEMHLTRKADRLSAGAGTDGLHGRAAGCACRHDHRDSRRARADCRAHHRNTRRAGHAYAHLHDMGRGGGPRCRL